jgi:hypothetical protein
VSASDGAGAESVDGVEGATRAGASVDDGAGVGEDADVDVDDDDADAIWTTPAVGEEGAVGVAAGPGKIRSERRRAPSVLML